MCHILFGIILYYYLLLFICSFFNVFVGVLITNTIQVKPWASRSHICRSSFAVASLPSFWVAGRLGLDCRSHDWQFIDFYGRKQISAKGFGILGSASWDTAGTCHILSIGYFGITCEGAAGVQDEGKRRQTYSLKTSKKRSSGVHEVLHYRFVFYTRGR